jgi:hypothetical protein
MENSLSPTFRSQRSKVLTPTIVMRGADDVPALSVNQRKMSRYKGANQRQHRPDSRCSSRERAQAHEGKTSKWELASGSLCTSQCGPLTSPIVLHILHLFSSPVEFGLANHCARLASKYRQNGPPFTVGQETTSVVKKQSDLRSRLLLVSTVAQKHAVSILMTGVIGKTMTPPAHVSIFAKDDLFLLEFGK